MYIYKYTVICIFYMYVKDKNQYKHMLDIKIYNVKTIRNSMKEIRI